MIGMGRGWSVNRCGLAQSQTRPSLGFWGTAWQVWGVEGFGAFPNSRIDRRKAVGPLQWWGVGWMPIRKEVLISI